MTRVVTHITPERRIGLVLAIGLVLSLGTGLEAVAQDATPADIQGIQDRFKAVTGTWSSAIAGHAERLFFFLIVIDLGWLAIKLVLNQADMSQISSQLSRRIIIVGLFLWLIRNGGFADQIIAGFTKLAGELSKSAGGADIGSITPAGTLGLGADTAVRMLGEFSLFNAMTGVFLALGALIVAITFAVIAARLLVAYVETYFVSVIGVFMLAFGGLDATKDLAQKFMLYIIAAGVKLFLMLMIVGVLRAVITDITSGWDFTTNYEVLVMTGVAMVGLVLVNKIPEMVQSIITGTAPGNGGGLMAMGLGVAGMAAGASVAVMAAKSAAAAKAAGGAAGNGALASPAAQAVAASLQGAKTAGRAGESGGG